MTMKLPDAISAQEETAGQGAQAMARTLGALFVALRVVIVLALLSLAFGGLFSVKENEEAMLFHFGRLETRNGAEILRSGNWYWAWPYPIDEIKRIPAQRSISITSRQFWPKIDPNNLQALQGGPAGPGANVLRAGEDGYLLTGDANIMHMAWTLTYRIADPKAYYLNFYEDPETLPDGKPFPAADRRGVEMLIQSALDDAVLGEVASWRVEDVLVSSRAAVPGLGDVAAARRGEALAAAVRARLGQRLSQLDLGIEVQQLSLVDTQPPAYTRAAFRQQIEAAQEFSSEMEKALAYQRRVVTEAEGNKSKIMAEASAYKTRVVATVRASASYFTKVLEEYRKNPGTMLVALHADTLRDVLKKAEARYVIHGRADGRQEIRLLLGPEPEKPKGNPLEANPNPDAAPKP